VISHFPYERKQLCPYADIETFFLPPLSPPTVAEGILRALVIKETEYFPFCFAAGDRRKSVPSLGSPLRTETRTQSKLVVSHCTLPGPVRTVTPRSRFHSPSPFGRQLTTEDRFSPDDFPILDGRSRTALTPPSLVFPLDTKWTVVADFGFFHS